MRFAKVNEILMEEWAVCICTASSGWPQSRNQKLYLELGGNWHQIDSAVALGVSISEPSRGTGSPARERQSNRDDSKPHGIHLLPF